MKPAPWALGAHPNEVNKLRERVGGPRLIHYERTYSASRDDDVAYLGHPLRVPQVLEHSPWHLVICGDERNFDGLSGTYQSPEDYASRWGRALEELLAEGIPYSTKGLGMINGRFDRGYHQRLADITFAPVRAVNCTPWEWPRARRAIEHYGGAWSVTLIPYRLNWHPWAYNTFFAWARQEAFRPFWRALDDAQRHPQIVNVGIWCLRENYLGDPHNTWQAWHGLIDRHGETTWQADVVKEAMG